MVGYQFIRRLLIVLACQFTLDLVFSTCPTDIESCYEGYDFWFYDIFPHPVVDPSVLDMQSCVEHCRMLPGCIAGSWSTGVHGGELICYCKFALAGLRRIATNVIVFTFANSTAVRTHCDDTTPSCQSLERIKNYIITETDHALHCGNSVDGDQLQFGDLDGDYMCDAICWNKNSGTVKWAKGAYTLKFVKPLNTPLDGSLGSFCTEPNSTLRVKDANWDSKDDLICIYSDNHQSAMLSDDNGPNPALIVSYVNCQNVPNECLFLDTPSSCAVCPTTGPIQSGIYAKKTGVQEFVVTCHDGYTYRGKQGPLGICNSVATTAYFKDGMCIKQTPANVMGQYSNKRINLDAVAIYKANVVADCGWICLDDMRCTAVQFRHGSGTCELFTTSEAESFMQDDHEYEVLFIKGT